MNTTDFLHLLFALLFSIIIAFGFYTGSDYWDTTGYKTRFRFLPMFSPLLLPLFLAALGLCYMIVSRGSLDTHLLADFLFPVFVQVAVYYALLLPLLPLLRKYFSARATAIAWILPNYLYVTVHAALRMSHPWLVLKLSSSLLRILLAVWLVGALLVLLQGIAVHLRYRKTLKESAMPVTDPRILNIWQAEQAALSVISPIQTLYESDAVTTPISVGLTRRSTMVILPRTRYTDGELRMIFRHEIVHILHNDAQSKLFLLLCTALCWFNPLMHLAARRCADDLELSCDELVLSSMEEPPRQEYANLILSSAGDDRGFSTCLSASAKSLQYRLGRILHPGKRAYGGIMVGMAFFLLLMTNGMVALAYGQTTAGTEMDGFLTGNSISAIRMSLGESDRAYTCENPDALFRLIEALPVGKLTGNQEFSTENRLYFTFPKADGTAFAELTDHLLTFGSSGSSQTIYLLESPDWQAIEKALTLVPYPVVNDFCRLWIALDDGSSLEMLPASVGKTEDDGSTSPVDFRGEICDGYTLAATLPVQIRMEFENNPLICVLSVHGQNHENTYDISDHDLEDGKLTLASYPAVYEIRVIYSGEFDYEATYYLTIDQAK